MGLFLRLWEDEAGFVISAELVLVATILVLGLIAGLVVIRNQVVQELADTGQAFGQLSQSYGYTSWYKPYIVYTDGSYFLDAADVCQDPAIQPIASRRGLRIGTYPEVFAKNADIAPGEVGVLHY